MPVKLRVNLVCHFPAPRRAEIPDMRRAVLAKRDEQWRRRPADGHKGGPDGGDRLRFAHGSGERGGSELSTQCWLALFEKVDDANKVGGPVAGHCHPRVPNCSDAESAP